MTGKAVVWLIHFQSKEQYHLCLSTPQILSYLRRHEPADYVEETKSYQCKIVLKRITSVTNLSNIFHGYKIRAEQVIVKTDNPINREMECTDCYVSIKSKLPLCIDKKMKAKKTLAKETTKKKKEDAKLWRLIRQLES